VTAHLAQINLGTMVAPVDDPEVAEFMAALEAVNAIADRAPGFVWRLQDDNGNATSIHLFADPLALVNMSVWESVETLRDYVYRTTHVEFFRRRAEWFRPEGKRVALWWVPAGTVPDVRDGVRRVEFLERHGPSPYAFGFARPTPPLLVEPVSLDDPGVLGLIGRLNAELGAMYEPDQNHFGLDAASVAGDLGALLRATYDGEPVGCGAVRRIAGGRFEVKRMYVDPARRGLKLGAALLDQLESHARRLGGRELVLETGIRQEAALALYRAAGFVPTALWGEYLASPETSRCFVKPLD
jgi:ribosomal protein S18 acetylase RimI-like enzyme